MNKTKGFTIIELIVVIAIIAVLAAIVAVNVTSYINKAKDSAIKGNLSTMQKAAAAIMGNGGSANGVCADLVYGGSQAYNAAAAAAGSAACNGNGSTNTWCACAPLKDGTFFCVSDVKKGVTANCMTACANGAAATCP